MKLRDYQITLIADTRVAFRTHRRPLVVLPCGGGKTVCFAEMAARHTALRADNYVWFLVHRRELIDQTLDTFDRFGIDRSRIMVAMVQTVARNTTRYTQPTLIIFDEAHHATARTWQRIIEKFPTLPMVGLTATPARLDGSPLGSVFDALVLGPSADWLTANGYLCEYDYYAPVATDLEYKIKGADYDMDEFSASLLRSKIYGDIGKYIDPSRKTLIYCPSVAFSQALCASVVATHFDGTTPDAERADIVARFRSGEIRVLSSVDLVGEGFDVPDCEAVIMLRPTQSLALYIQQAMRCLRPGPGKRAVIYDMVGNVYRHGIPTEPRDWSLTQARRCRNASAEPDLLVRECKTCHRVYTGTASLCPYCGAENGKTRKEIEQDTAAELERVQKVERRKQGMARSYEQLVEIGRQRGYKNPEFWARAVWRGRTERT